MPRKLLNRKGKTSSNEEFICQHMCNHYRRILNVKKVVDTSPPYSYKYKLPGKKVSLTNGVKKAKPNRNLSPAMTDRSLSTNSYKASSWGTESFISSSRYHANCIPLDPSPASSRKQGVIDMNLINQITYDTKNGPAAYCCQNCTTMKAQDANKKHNVVFDTISDKRETTASASKCPPSMKSSNESNEKSKCLTQRKSSKVMSKKSQSQTSFGSNSRPRILKTEVVSKLRSLRVYYPPRRKIKRETGNSWDASDKRAVNVTRKEFDICMCSSNQSDFKKPADAVKEQTSSRDSAYNGGVSSLPESRSPTPDHRNKMGCTCGERTRIQSKTVEVCKYVNDGQFKSGETATRQPRLSPQKKKPEEEDTFKKMKEDASYVKFIQDITVEVLEKGLFTNKAIKKVMRKHILENLQTLEKDRMMKEVENLRIQLGVPEDKCLLEFEENNEDSSSVIYKAYPVISDSAFSLPESLKENHTNPSGTGVANSVSQILQAAGGAESGSNSDDDLVSVIQIAKKLRERVPSRDSSSEEGNSNRKKRPKVSKLPKTTFGHPKGFFSSSSPSPSSSGNEGMSDTLERKSLKGQARKKSGDSSCMCDEKKTVTFDNSNEIRQWDGKHIQLIVCTNDSQKNDRNKKAKND